MKTDILIIGAGPAGIFTALELIRKGYKGHITLVEKGQSVEKRHCPKAETGRCMNCKPYCHITTGFSGAGAFSDGKLSLSYEVGGDLPTLIGEEFAQELIDYTDKSYDAGASVAKSAKEGLCNAVSKIGDFIENGIDSQPTIRPLLDLSDVTEGAGRLSALLSRNQAMKISAGMEHEGTGIVQNGGTTPTSGNNYNFTQNNYSPKALSRIDIYRQTKNQFSALKGLVET